MLPHPSKKQRPRWFPVAADVDNSSSHFLASFDDLADMLGNIFEFFPLKGIMLLRCVCKEWREAAKRTIVPLSNNFNVNNVAKYNIMREMTTALPNLPQIMFEDYNMAYERVRMKGRVEPGRWWATSDFGIISNFSKLRILQIFDVPLNGRFPSFFNFPLLEKLSIKHCPDLKWDLEMLAGLPSLKKLKFVGNNQLTGNIKSLRALRDTLEEVAIRDCDNIEGDPMDLAGFASLKTLDLRNTAVAGDIRGIGKTDFTSLAHLTLPKRVHGVEDKFQYVSSDGIFKVFALDSWERASYNTWTIISVDTKAFTANAASKHGASSLQT